MNPGDNPFNGQGRSAHQFILNMFLDENNNPRQVQVGPGARLEIPHEILYDLQRREDNAARIVIPDDQFHVEEDQEEEVVEETRQIEARPSHIWENLFIAAIFLLVLAVIIILIKRNY